MINWTYFVPVIVAIAMFLWLGWEDWLKLFNPMRGYPNMWSIYLTIMSVILLLIFIFININVYVTKT